MKTEARSQKPEAGNSSGLQPSAFSLQPSQRGVALVLTLILLSVALVMAVAFLAISGHERGAVTTQTDTTTTRLAADAGLAAAEAQIAANVLSTTNPFNYGLLVSTNYVVPPLVPLNPVGDLTNLFILPRAPVWLTNLVTRAMENRFYLDLNRNSVDDPNGWIADTDNLGRTNGNYTFQTGDPEWIGVLQRPDLPYGPQNPFVARYAYIALPAGNALDLNAIHNQVFDEAFAGPSGGPIIMIPPASLDDPFFRNQGVGTWELNLAAFLVDLNTNQWGLFAGGPPVFPNTTYYYYRYTMPQGNRGRSFDDARALLAFRYANNYNTLASVDKLFGGPFPTGIGDLAFRSDNIDGYSDGPLQTGFSSPGDFISPIINDNPTLPWPGADSTNRFFDLTADLFDSTKTGVGLLPATINAGNYFTGRLLASGTGLATYNRYTFYRLLSQLGTESAPESGLMNLNYDNLMVTNGSTSATNYMPWTPLRFFTNAADRLLKAYTAEWAAGHTNIAGTLVATNDANYVATFNVTAPFGVTSIPVWVSNRFVYTPAVNRLLQLAANMYDATVTNHFPDIFRPLFTVVVENGNNDVYITGYTNLDTLNAIGPLLVDHNTQMTIGGNNGVLDPPIEVTALPLGVTNFPANVYGVPWIVGAKKGFPNFNAFSVESAFQLVRKLEVMRNTNATPQPDITWTNQMYLVNITNFMGLSCWNSYRSSYPGPVDIVVRCGSSMMLTNDNNLNPPYTFATNFAFATELSPWPAWSGVAGQASPSFVVPLNTSFLTLTNAMYYYHEPNPPNVAMLLNYIGDSPSNYLDRGIQPLPHFWLMMTNRLQVAIIDYSTNVSPLNASVPTVGRIVDYVQLGGMDSKQLLNSALDENGGNSFWSTNGPQFGQQIIGVQNQVLMSEYGTVNGYTPTGSGAWSTAQIPGGPANDVSPAAQQAFFRGFFNANGYYSYNGQTYYNTLSAMQAPYTPVATTVQHTTWEANDPLVHYLATDLAPHTTSLQAVDWASYSLNTPTTRYQPWGLSPPTYVSALDQDQNPVNLAFKDPLVRGSDNWDFPAGRLPTIGWLGRVHRGTPWQTVFLKATNIVSWANNVGQSGLNTWKTWTGDANLFDATNSAPINDHLLFDLFTTAFNDNATRGQLSVNVASNSLAAWSAVFSGIVALTNNLPNFVAGLASQPRYQNPPSGFTPALLPVAYTNLIISPAGPNGMNSALGQIVAGIDRTRATFTNTDGLVGVFEHKGDLLAVPQLTERSPFLNWSSTAQQGNGISDEMYEWLPQQMMSLVRDGSSPRYVIYSFGQALKPAKDGTYLAAGPLFGMVTNYQVVAETATRAVIRFDTMRTNAPDGTIIMSPPRAVIERFNILPPN